MTDLDIEQITRLLGLKALPVEGGLYRETYRSADIVPTAALPERYQQAGERPGAGARSLGSAIYYLLTAQPGSFSALHRLKTDEIYHFYLGDPLELSLFFPDGSSQQIILGQDLLHGQTVQAVVPQGIWQGSRLLPGGRYALLGTTLAPAYLSDDFEIASRAALLQQYPRERQRILALTRD